MLREFDSDPWIPPEQMAEIERRVAELRRQAESKGDFEGHPFRGNQWSGDGGDAHASRTMDDIIAGDSSISATWMRDTEPRRAAAAARMEKVTGAKANLGTMNPKLAEDVANRLEDLAREYPKVAQFITDINCRPGEPGEVMWTDGSHIPMLLGDSAAEKDPWELGFSSQMYGGPDADERLHEGMGKAIANGVHVAAFQDTQLLLDHEFGHLIDAAAGNQTISERDDVHHELTAYVPQLGAYAGTGGSEAFAEAFALQRNGADLPDAVTNELFAETDKLAAKAASRAGAGARTCANFIPVDIWNDVVYSGKKGFRYESWLRKEYDEDLHPRDEHGRWTAAGSEAGTSFDSLIPAQRAAIEASLKSKGLSYKEMHERAAIQLKAGLADPAVREEARDWYGKMRDLADQRARALGYTSEEAQRHYCGFVAATSPHNHWDTDAGGHPNLDSADLVGRLYNENPRLTVTQDIADQWRDAGYRPMNLDDQIGRTQNLRDMDPEVAGRVLSSEGRWVEPGVGHVMFTMGISALESAGSKDPIDGIGGPKTRAFYEQLATRGDSPTAAVDVYMLEALSGKDAANKGSDTTIQLTMLAQPETGPTVAGRPEGWIEGATNYTVFDKAVQQVAAENNMSVADAQATIWVQQRDHGFDAINAVNPDLVAGTGKRAVSEKALSRVYDAPTTGVTDLDALMEEDWHAIAMDGGWTEAEFRAWWDAGEQILGPLTSLSRARAYAGQIKGDFEGHPFRGNQWDEGGTVNVSDWGYSSAMSRDITGAAAQLLGLRGYQPPQEELLPPKDATATAREFLHRIERSAPVDTTLVSGHPGTGDFRVGQRFDVPLMATERGTQTDFGRGPGSTGGTLVVIEPGAQAMKYSGSEYITSGRFEVTSVGPYNPAEHGLPFAVYGDPQAEVHIQQIGLLPIRDEKGDFEGHPFRGNQWSDGGDGEADRSGQTMPERIAAQRDEREADIHAAAAAQQRIRDAGVRYVTLTGMDSKAQVVVADRVEAFASKYPGAMRELTSVDTAIANEGLRLTEKNIFAQVKGDIRGNDSIVFNGDMFSDIDRIEAEQEKNFENGFHPQPPSISRYPGTEQIVDHELGHVLDHFVRSQQLSGRMEGVYTVLEGRPTTSGGGDRPPGSTALLPPYISGYATEKGDGEAFAEAYTVLATGGTFDDPTVQNSMTRILDTAASPPFETWNPPKAAPKPDRPTWTCAGYNSRPLASVKSETKADKPQNLDFLAHWNSKVDKWQDEIRKVITGFVEHHRRVTIAKLGGPKAKKGTRHWDPPGEKKIDPKRVVNDKRWRDELTADMNALMEKMVAEMGQDAFDRIMKAVKVQLQGKGDEPGHPFRGNQWTGEGGGSKEPQTLAEAHQQAIDEQRVGTIERRDGKKLIARLDWHRFESAKVVKVGYIEVAKEHQHTGVAVSMLQELTSRFPDHELAWGVTTQQGEQLRRAWEAHNKGDFEGHPFRGNQWGEGGGLPKEGRPGGNDDPVWDEIAKLQALGPDYPPGTQERITALFDKNREAERVWDKKVGNAISTGKLTVAEAHERYGKLDVDMIAERAGARYEHTAAGQPWQPLPEGDLYHITTAGDAVERDGLKTRDELGQQRGHGLGGGADNTISLTTDQELAGQIRESMLQARDVAAGVTPIGDLVENARTGADADRPYLDHVMRFYDTDWKMGDPLPPQVEALTRDQYLTREGFEPSQREYRDATPTDRMGFYKDYSAWREQAGGLPDPLFFSADADALAATDPSQIQTVTVQAVPGAMGVQPSAMSEWRILTGQTVTMKSVKAFNYEAWLKGDFEGHPFRGNQWGNASPEALARAGPWGHGTPQTEAEALRDEVGVNYGKHGPSRAEQARIAGGDDPNPYISKSERAIERVISHKQGMEIMHKQVDFTGMDEKAAADVADRVLAFAKEFPGTARDIYHIDMAVIPTGEYAQTVDGRNITFNSDVFGVDNIGTFGDDDADDASSVLPYTVGSGITSVTDHELGHVLDVRLAIAGSGHRDMSAGAAEVWGPRGGPGPDISGYALDKGNGEAFAEAFAARQGGVEIDRFIAEVLEKEIASEKKAEPRAREGTRTCEGYGPARLFQRKVAPYDSVPPFEDAPYAPWSVVNHTVVPNFPTDANVTPGKPMVFEEADPNVASLIESRTQKLADFSDEMSQGVRDRVADGERAGKSINDIAADLNDYYGNSDFWAERIAQTEVNGGMNAASMIAAAQTMVIGTKSWNAMEDELTRESHQQAEADGPIPFDEKFQVGDAEMDHPGDEEGPAEEVINCRCVVTFSTDPDLIGKPQPEEEAPAE